MPDLLQRIWGSRPQTSTLMDPQGPQTFRGLETLEPRMLLSATPGLDDPEGNEDPEGTIVLAPLSNGLSLGDGDAPEMSSLADPDVIAIADYFDPTVGDWWQMTGEVNEVGINGLIQMVSGPRINGFDTVRMDIKVPNSGNLATVSRFFTQTANGTEVMRQNISTSEYSDSETFSSPVLFFPAEMVEDGIYNFSGTSTISSSFGNWTATMSGTSVFTGFETITVEAGTFDAARIELNWTFNKNGPLGFTGEGEVQEVYWFAEDIGFIRWDRESSEEYSDGTKIDVAMSLELVVSNRIPLGPGDPLILFTDNVQYVDDSGTQIQVSLSDGTGRFQFTGDGMGSELGRNGFIVTGDNLFLEQLEIFDTTDRDRLTIDVRGGDGSANIGLIQGDSPLGQVDVRGNLAADFDMQGASISQFNVRGDFTGGVQSGDINRFDVRGNLDTDGSTFSIGEIDRFGVSGNLLGELATGAINRLDVRGDLLGTLDTNGGDVDRVGIRGNIDGELITGAINRLDVRGDLRGLVDTDGQAIDRLGVRGLFDADMNVGAINRMDVRGDFLGNLDTNGGAIDRFGVRGNLVGDLETGAINRLDVRGDLLGSIDTNGGDIDRLGIRGLFEGSIVASNINRLDVRGNFGSLSGDRSLLDANRVDRLAVRGNMSNTDILLRSNDLTNPGVGQLDVRGDMIDTDMYIGFAGFDPVPVDPATGGRLERLSVRGTLINSNVIAKQMGQVSFSSIDIDNDGVAFGLITERIDAYSDDVTRRTTFIAGQTPGYPPRMDYRILLVE